MQLGNAGVQPLLHLNKFYSVFETATLEVCPSVVANKEEG